MAGFVGGFRCSKCILWGFKLSVPSYDFLEGGCPTYIAGTVVRVLNIWGRRGARVINLLAKIVPPVPVKIRSPVACRRRARRAGCPPPTRPRRGPRRHPPQRVGPEGPASAAECGMYCLTLKPSMRQHSVRETQHIANQEHSMQGDSTHQKPLSSFLVYDEI